MNETSNGPIVVAGVIETIAFFVFVFAYWYFVKRRTPADPQQVAEMLLAHSAVLVDIREAKEVNASGKAKGAIWFPASKIEAGGAEWEAFRDSLPKDKLIVFYCAAGGRAGRVAKQVAADGFRTDNLGGLRDWTNAGLPVEPGP